MNNGEIHKHCHIPEKTYELENNNLQTMQNTNDPRLEGELNTDLVYHSDSEAHLGVSVVYTS